MRTEGSETQFDDSRAQEMDVMLHEIQRCVVGNNNNERDVVRYYLGGDSSISKYCKVRERIEKEWVMRQSSK